MVHMDEPMRSPLAMAPMITHAVAVMEPKPPSALLARVEEVQAPGDAGGRGSASCVRLRAVAEAVTPTASAAPSARVSQNFLPMRILCVSPGECRD